MSSPVKILCIGAYGNGNIGDIYQADALGFALKQLKPEASISSLSPSKRGMVYPALYTKPESPERLYDGSFLNSFNLILVGGGGLVASPHHPLPDPEWIRLINVPVCTVGIGVAEKHAADARPFLEACARVTVRDEYSLAAMRPVRPDAKIVMDPILMAPERFHSPPPPGKRNGILWVPGKLRGETATFYADVYKEHFDPKHDRIVSFNEIADKGSGFEGVFGDKVAYIHAVEPFLDLCSKARLVVSERYHGCIFAIRADVPCVGVALRSHVVTSKITELYRRMGMSDSIVTPASKWSRSALRLKAESADYARSSGFLTSERATYMAYLSECLALASAPAGDHGSANVNPYLNPGFSQA